MWTTQKMDPKRGRKEVSRKNLFHRIYKYLKNQLVNKKK